MRRTIALVLLGVAAVALRTRAQTTDVGLIPGLTETADYVSYWHYVLANSGHYNPFEVSSLNTSSSVSDQTSAVLSYLSGYGYGSGTVLVGHSQGGLVSRYTSRSAPLAGLLTVASPNAGAPIASSGALFTVQTQQALVGFETFQINQGQSVDFNSCNGCSQAWYEVNDFLVNLLNYFSQGMTALYLIPFLAANPYLPDLAPGSGVVSSLVNSPGLEQATVREAVAVDVQDYGAAPFRLIWESGTADAVASAVGIWSLELDLDGLSLYENATDEGECFDTNVCPTIANIGNSMMIVADIIGDLPFTVNYSVVGGVPNDALVPTANESLPDKGPFRTVFGLTHQEILNDGQDVVQGVDHITGRS